MKLGFIGLGIMGSPMAGHLLAAGHEVYAQSRRGVPQAIKEAGARPCASATEVGKQADIIFTMVPDTPHVEEVLFGAQGLAHGLSAGKTVVDMSSISPIATKTFA
ncbi:MAG: NAD(P)-dependent oxidoreductase, partial [Betaproteobacteria bacterium]